MVNDSTFKKEIAENNKFISKTLFNYTNKVVDIFACSLLVGTVAFLIFLAIPSGSDPAGQIFFNTV